MAKKLPEINPFVQPASGFVINARWKVEKLTLSGTIEAGSGGTQYRTTKIETDNRTALYTDSVLGFFCDLSSAAKDMFMYIAAHLPYKQDYMELSEVRYCEDMQVSRRTFYDAKAQLTNRVIIPRERRANTYWVNPALLFKGNRMEAYPHFVRMENTHPFERLDGTV